MRLILLPLFVLLAGICAQNNTLERSINGDYKPICKNSKQIFETILAAYKFQRRPNEIGVKVYVEVWVQEVTSVNELTSDFTLDLYVTELWLDHALNYEKLNPCKQNITMSHKILDKIWKPNTVFINSKHAEMHSSPFKNVFLLVYPNGTVWANYRMKVVGPCVIDFASFPMDHQWCHLTMESFSYNRAEVDMEWNPMTDHVSLVGHKSIELPDFVLINWTTATEYKEYPAGIWSELSMIFYFKRRFGWYILQAYIPTYLTIFISWINFCLGIRMIPARTMIGINALVVLIFQFGNIMTNLPKVSYVKALDVWMLASFVFVFGSIVELAIVAYGTQKEECTWTKKVDKLSCIIFPSCFSIFNLIYWSYYLINADSTIVNDNRLHAML